MKRDGPCPLRRRWGQISFWTSGAIFVTAAGYAAFRLDHLDSRERFNARTDSVRQTLAHHLEGGQRILHSLTALYQASGTLSNRELASVSRKLLKPYPHFGSVAYLSWVRGPERRAFERRIRGEGIAGYRIRNSGPSGLIGVPAGARASYLAISFLSPLKPSTAHRLGLDILSQPGFATVARRAIADGVLAVSPEAGRFTAIMATYRGKDGATSRENRTARVSGAFMMAFDIVAILREVRTRYASVTIDLVPVDRKLEDRWRELGITLPATPPDMYPWFSPQHLAGWNHALGDLRFGIRIRSKPGSHGFHTRASLFAMAMALILVLGFGYWLRHRRRDREHHLALEEREGRLSAVLNTVIDGIITIDDRGIIETFNPAAERMFGYTHAEVSGRNVSMLMPQSEAEHHDDYLAAYAHAGETRAIARSRELCAQRSDGSRFPIELSLSEASLGDRTIYTGIIRDISGRKRAEAALKRSEERFRDFADTASDWFWEVDKDLKYTFLSDEYFERFRISRNQIIGCSFGGFSMDKESSEFQAGVAAVQAGLPFRDFRFTVLFPNGISAEINFSGKPIHRPDGTFDGYRGTATDMTDRRRLEEQLIQARRLEAIGKLSGGVAHEFNNLLSVIGGFARMAKRNPDNPDCLAEAVDTIIQAVEQGVQLTRQMLAFSRKQELAPKLVAISEIVDGVKPLLPPLMGENVELVFDAHLSSRVRIDPNQLSQAILNLAANSRDAMPNGGTLTISTAVETFETPRRIGQRAAEPGRYVALKVRDTGHGIAAEDMSIIFEPFYTTKEVDKGSGLGLSMVYGLLAQSGGFIDVVSAPGEGAEITLYLPEMADPPQTVASGDGPAERLALVVEDHEGTREVTAMTLEDEGFTVAKAVTVDEVLDNYGDRPPPFQILVCDAALPNAGTASLVEKLRENIPALRVIYLVQQSAPPENRNPELAEFTRTIQRPIDPDLLIDLVGEIL